MGAFHEDATIAIGKRIVELSIPPGSASAAIGIRAAVFPSTCSGSGHGARRPVDAGQGVEPYRGRG